MKIEPWPELALDVEPAAMAVDDVLDDGEAEPGAAQLARAGGIDAVEALGQARQMLARDAVAVVAHRDGDAAARSPAARGDRPTAARDSIGVPRRPYLMALSSRFWNTCASSSASPSTRGSAGRQLEHDAHVARGGAQLERVGDAAAARCARSTRVGRRDVLVHLDARQRQQIVDQPRHALRLLAHDGEEALARRGVVARRRRAASR